MAFEKRLILSVLIVFALAMASSARNTIPLLVSGNKELLARVGRSLKIDIDGSFGSSKSDKVSASLMDGEVLDYQEPGANPGHTPPVPPMEFDTKG